MKPLFVAADSRLFSTPEQSLRLVDLGFSKTIASTGVWCNNPQTSCRKHFGEAVMVVTGILTQDVEPTCLVLESPLSCFINDKGNPEAYRPRRN